MGYMSINPLNTSYTIRNNAARHQARLSLKGSATTGSTTTGTHNNAARHQARLSNNGSNKTLPPSTNPTAVNDWNGKPIQGLTQNAQGQVLDNTGVAIQGLQDKNGTLINTADNKAVTSLKATGLGGGVVDEAGVAVPGLYVDSTMSAYTKNGTPFSMGPGPALPPNQPFEMRDIRNSADKVVISGFAINSSTGQVSNSGGGN